MEIKVLNEKDTQAYRTIRLNALTNNPESFGSSYEEESVFEEERFTKRITKSNGLTFGAFFGHKLVGICNLTFQPRKKMNHRADLFSMYVEPDYRGTGIGKRLLENAIETARKNEPVRQLYLTVVRSNTTAKRLYDSFGFQTYGIDKQAMRYDGKFYDHELMVLIFKEKA